MSKPIAWLCVHGRIELKDFEKHLYLKHKIVALTRPSKKLAKEIAKGTRI